MWIEKNEGVSIARNALSVARIDQLDVDNGKWFIVQTNTDQHVEDPDGRRTGAIQKLNKLGNNIDYKTLYENVSSQYPNNFIETIVIAIQAPATNYFNSTLWLP